MFRAIEAERRGGRRTEGDERKEAEEDWEFRRGELRDWRNRELANGGRGAELVGKGTGRSGEVRSGRWRMRERG